jgi:transposase
MEEDDARKLKPAAQHERRKQVIRAHKRGRTRTEIAVEVGLSYTAVSKTIARYEELGAAALAPRTRGRRSGQDRALTQAQEQAVQQLICDKRPEQLKMEFALWSRAAVMQLIRREYGIVLHVRSVGKYLKRWGFTPQKPIKRAYEQSPVAVKAWLDTQYPEIAKQAKAQGGEIYWGDETALVNTDVRGRSFAPKGKTPVTMVIGGTRQKLSMIASVTNQGKARWMIIDGAFNHERLIEFFESLIKDAGKKIFLILDNLSVHHCKPVKAWVAANSDKMEV